MSNTFSLTLDYPLENIRSITLRVEGTNAWHCQGIGFRFRKGERSSGPHVFLNLDKWFSEEEEDPPAVDKWEFKVRPSLQ